MIHTCSICGRKLVCDGDCDYPEKFPMNCGIESGELIHQDAYEKAIKEEKH